MRPPEALPLESVSPSRFKDLSECQLRLAFKQHAEKPAAKSDPQIIGDSLHAALSAFIDADEYRQTHAVALASTRFAAELEAQAEGREVKGSRPAAARFAKVVGRVLELLEEAGHNAITFTEEFLQSRDGAIHGLVDLIITSDRSHLIADYKTGPSTDEEGQVTSHFQTQVQLYAALERERSGQWPDRAVLLRFGGPPVPIDVEPGKCEETADRAVALLAAYNEFAGAVPPASPSADTCLFCAFAPSCPSFWDALSPGWRRGAVRGRVAWAESSETGALTVGLDDADGSFSGNVIIRRLDAERLGLGLPEPGNELAVCGVRADPDGRLVPDKAVRARVWRDGSNS